MPSLGYTNHRGRQITFSFFLISPLLYILQYLEKYFFKSHSKVFGESKNVKNVTLHQNEIIKCTYHQRLINQYYAHQASSKDIARLPNVKNTVKGYSWGKGPQRKQWKRLFCISLYISSLQLYSFWCRNFITRGQSYKQDTLQPTMEHKLVIAK